MLLHPAACGAARQLPIRTGLNRRQYRRDVCVAFGLILADAEAVDGACQPGEPGPVGLDGKPGPPTMTLEERAAAQAAKEAAEAEAARLRKEEEERKAEEEKKAKGKGGKPAAAAAVASPAPVEPEPVDPLLELPLLVTPRGTTYR